MSNLSTRKAREKKGDSNIDLFSELFSSLIFCCVISPLEKSKISSLNSCILVAQSDNQSKYGKTNR